jgi:protease-4
MPGLPFGRSRVALLELSGTISGTQKIHSYARLLERIRESPRSRALVVNIDFGGGSAAGSDYLYHSLERVARRKPVVAFIGGTGASGAYLIACAAQRIVALPSALVGSIGVLAVRPDFQSLLDRLGVQVHISKVGRLKDSWNYYRTPTDEESEKLQGLLDSLYQAFVGRVAERRRLSTETVLELATGEPFAAPRAVELCLVDELGDLDRALDLAAEMAGIRRRYHYVQPRRAWQDRLLGQMTKVVMDGVADTLLEGGSHHLYYR